MNTLQKNIVNQAGFNVLDVTKKDLKAIKKDLEKRLTKQKKNLSKIKETDMKQFFVEAIQDSIDKLSGTLKVVNTIIYN